MFTLKYKKINRAYKYFHFPSMISTIVFETEKAWRLGKAWRAGGQENHLPGGPTAVVMHAVAVLGSEATRANSLYGVKY